MCKYVTGQRFPRARERLRHSDATVCVRACTTHPSVLLTIFPENLFSIHLVIRWTVPPTLGG